MQVYNHDNQNPTDHKSHRNKRGTYRSERSCDLGDLMSTAKTVLIIAVLCVVLSGCIETREYECRDDTGKKQQITDINTVDVDDITDCDNKSVIMIVNRKVYKG